VLADDPLVDLQAHWRSYWPGIDAEAVAADARERLEAARSAWGLEGVTRLPGGNVGVVCAASRGGTPVVVKVAPRGHDEERRLAAEGDALDHWRATAAVPELFDCRDDGLTLLMERLEPGITADDARLAPAAHLELLGDLAARLHRAGPPSPAFETARSYAATWPAALAGDAELASILDELSAPSDEDVLVHADLHGGNALRSGSEWKAIDPHAVRADRHLDVWALIDPLAPALPGDSGEAVNEASERCARYAAAAQMDAGRAAAWARVRAAVEASQIATDERASRHDRAWAARLIRMANALAMFG